MGRPKRQLTMADDGCVMHAGFRIRRREWGSGNVGYQADLGKRPDGKRWRKQFPTLTAARNYCDRMAVEKEQRGLAAFNLPDTARRDAVEALRILKGTGASLTDAARAYAQEHAPPSNGVMFEELCGDFVEWLQTTPRKLAAKSPGRYRPSTIADVQNKLNRVCRDLGDTAAADVNAAELREWLNSQGFHPTTWDNHRRAVSMLYSWATGDDGPLAGGDNPASELRPPATPETLPDIFTPETVRDVLRHVAENRPELVAYFACGFFAGLRPDERRRITPDALDFEHGEIRIPPTASKTHGERLVTMPDNLRQWLNRYPPDAGQPLGPSYSTLARVRRKIRDALGIDWPKDVARHSYATYSAALYGMDETADQLGHHSTKMLHDHYKGLVRNRKAAARRFFAITPGNEGGSL